MIIGLRIICLAVGYLFGSVQTAYFYGKAKGIDIREHGSGNAGTTNTLRVLGTKAGLIVFAGDAGKCILAVLLTRLTLGDIYPEFKFLFVMYTALGVILGHDFPFYMNFKGGKGIACTAGLCIAIHPLFIPVAAALFILPVTITHYVSLGSLLINVGLVVEMIIFGQSGRFAGHSQATLIEMYIITVIIAFFAFYRHRANIGRLLKGEERKTYLFMKPKAEKKPDEE